ncbi:MAG: hypothetical protein SXA11_03760 [Cyanobacteriota bacterium]|nr:hypothetical protein [Cyanobacteriota bacterium]
MLMKEKLNWGFIIPTIIGFLLPAIYVLYLISQAGHLLNFDYWWMIKNIYSIDGFSTNPFDWMFRANEHFVLIPAIIYALNIVITKGSNIGLCLATFLLAVVQSVFLIKLLPEKVTGNSRVLRLLIICISLFNFTPAAAHNWMRGYSGVHWVIANLFVIASIYCQTKLLQSNPNKWAIASIIFGILGCISYSTPLALWPILCAASLLMRLPRRIIIAYFTCTILVVGTYFITYKTPSHHPSLSQVNLVDTLAYIPVYLGAIFSHNIPVALIIGTFGLILAAVFHLYWLLSKPLNNIDWLPWLSIIIYSFGTALMAAISRSGFGIEQAIASRYATLPALFWLSLIVLTIFRINQTQISSISKGKISETRFFKKTGFLDRLFRKKQYFLIPVVAVVTVLTILTYGVGGKTAEAIALRATYQPLVALSVQLNIADPLLIQEKVGNRPEAFISLLDALKAHNLVPFHKNIKNDNFCVPLGIKIDSNLLTNEPQENVPGYFDPITQYTPATARVKGWVGESDKIKCIAILNQDRIVRGFGMSGFPRPDVAEIMGSEFESSGWKGYIEASPDDVLAAYVSLKNRPGWVVLRDKRSLINN